MTAMQRLLRAGGVLAVCLGLVEAVGCGGETRHEVFMQGLQIEGEAERGVCKLVVPEGAAAAELSGDQVHACLRRTEEAIALYERAATMGEDPDVKRVLERAHERKQKLESMLKMVRQMERDQIVAPQPAQP